MNQYLSKMIMVAILIEGIVTYFNEFFVSGNMPWQMICSLVLGIITSVSYNCLLYTSDAADDHCPV